MAAVAAIAVALLSGCAMTSNGRGGMLMSVDTAGIFGTEVGKFTLRDNSEGTLRRASNGEFSVKLDRYMRVVTLQNAISARVARVETIGQRTVVVIETQERNCPYKYEVLAIDGSDVLEWKIGNCIDRPRVQKSADGQALAFDFPLYNQLSRQLYTDNRMLTSTIPVPPGVDVRTKPFADQALQAPAAPQGDGVAAGGRYMPAPPQRDDSAPRQSASAAPAARTARNSAGKASDPAPTPKAAPRKANTQAPASPSWTFSGEEVKAIPIDLR